MGREFVATCRNCGGECTISDGGGFVFHLLHCDQCGGEKGMPFDEIGEPHLRYLKGLAGPYSMATAEHDRDVKENYPGEPLAEDEYHRIVEEMAGTCTCGGRFRFDAPPRCPNCHSDDLEYDEDRPSVMYD